MKIYNTLTRKKEALIPLKEKTVSIYSCGPTVYNYIHIGNARPVCVFDVLRRYLKWIGYDVKYIQNFTDVDDKIIKKANDEGVCASDISEKYIAEYKKDAENLNVMPADIHPKVTENMDTIIKLIEVLIDKGFAYERNGDVYYRTSRFDGYGKLSGMPIEDLIEGARIDINEQKDEPLDFALWKKAKENEPSWDSPWGKGRPGWHIECSAMSQKYVGNTLDIHCGGQDLIFPHHENEIAQSEASSGEPLAKYWMHNGYLNIDNRKMSKSSGNFFTVREIGGKYGYETIRYLMLQAHYRSPINFSDELLSACIASLERLYNCKDNLKRTISSAADGEVSENAKAIFKNRKAQFSEALRDDLNTADAITAIFELVRELNTMASDTTVSKQQLSQGLALFEELTDVLGLLYKKEEQEIPSDIASLANQRAEARKAKNFALADELREKIINLGYVIEETRQGTVIRKK